MIYKFISAEWKYIKYNYGNHFNGFTFTAPIKGLYSFLSTAAYESAISRSAISHYRTFPPMIRCLVNGNVAASALSNISTNQGYWTERETINTGHILLQTTLELNAKDRVYIQLHGTVKSLDDSTLTYFEGKLVSAIME